MIDLDTSTLRAAFGSFMTGVTVVTTRDATGAACGFTANSFTSVSLDPPLLLVCPGKVLSSYHAFENCTHFAVNVLAEGQEEVSNTFAGFKGDRFARTAHTLNDDGIPLISGAVAQFSCRTHQRVEAGDHCVLIGVVTDVAHTPGRGLGYVGGRYFSLGLERGVQEAEGRDVICGAIVETPGHVWLEQTPQGYRPPQIERTSRVSLRDDLAQHLRLRGIAARLGAAYSVFDTAATHSAYILASAPPPQHTDLHPISIDALPALTWATPPIADMMARFAREARTRDFSLYLGDAVHGETHTQIERT
ncbi:MAG: flavin reductase family protein [Pseudomonadota bacterium]